MYKLTSNRYKLCCCKWQDPRGRKKKLSLRELALSHLIDIFFVAVLLSFFIVFLQGFHVHGFNLDDSIVKMLISGVILGVIALMKIVINSLFK